MSHPPNLPQCPRALANRVLVVFSLVAILSWLGFGAYRWRTLPPSSFRVELSAPGVQSGHKGGSDCAQEIFRTQPNREALFHAAQGDALLAEGDYAAAAEAYRLSIKAYPAFEPVHCKLGVCLSYLGLFDEAIDSLNESINVAPDYPDAHYELGKVLSRTMRYDEAAEHLREVTRLQPNRPEPYNHLGLAWARHGQLRLATAAFSRAVALEPQNLAARFNLAQVFLQQGAAAPAARELEHILRMNPNFSAAKTALNQLKIRGNSPDSRAAPQPRQPRNQPVGALVLVPDRAALRSE